MITRDAARATDFFKVFSPILRDFFFPLINRLNIEKIHKIKLDRI
jgi:hypothetical protein